MQASLPAPGQGSSSTVVESFEPVAHTFEQHVMRTRKGIFRMVCKELGNLADAEDITQEALLRAWTHYASFEAHRSFEAWVKRIAFNLCIDHKRRLNRRPYSLSLDAYDPDEIHPDVCFQQPPDTTQDPLRRLLVTDEYRRLRTSLDCLPRVNRECLLLLSGNLSYEDIARTLGCSMGTVRSRIHRTRRKVRWILEQGERDQQDQGEVVGETRGEGESR